MEIVFILLVIVLIGLAISDLWVGVSNDAVNFLNSAIGSKSAPFWAIMIIASAGMMLGAAFSDGMMEVARNSIFHPEMFSFNEIMVIFLAVMITDVILLDTFNSLGLPTSTTVSVVFELLGGAIAVALIKINKNLPGSNSVLDYINSGETLTIISGILLSIVFAFILGSIVQFFVRMLFSFNYKKTYKQYGAVWGGFAITCITYFLLIKGAKDTSFMTDATKALIKANSWKIIGFSFIFWTFILGLIQMFTKLNILKIIVLVGTFALAMAFAGNDLVNFIGVPLAGLVSWQNWQVSGVSPQDFSMESLSQKIQTPPIYLIIAGIIMVIALWVSKKARTVTATEINLTRQDSGFDRFESSMFSRFIVRQFVRLSKAVYFILPSKTMAAIEKRFTEKESSNQEENAAFDLVRASVNLTVSSILIAFGTSMKLPLSTTYVTFMVAMASAFADGAWGRESAVYRVSGVATVIGGWFFTALIALTSSFLIALFIYHTNYIAVPILLVISILLIIKSNLKHRRKRKEDEKIEIEKNEKQDLDILESCTINVVNSIKLMSDIFNNTIISIASEDRKKLKKQNKEVERLSKNTKSLKEGVETIIYELKEDSIDSGHYYVQVLDYLREISNSLTHITKPVFEHFDNQHNGFIKEKNRELADINKEMQTLFNIVVTIITNKKFDNLEETLKVQQRGLDLTTKFRINEVKRIKNAQVGTKNSILFLNIIAEAKNIFLFTGNLLKSHRDFIVYKKA